MTHLARRVVLLAVVAWCGVARADELARTVDAAIQKIGKGATVSVLARVVGSGETLYARNETTPLVPASTMKLATTAAALQGLGGDYEHVTRVLARGTVEAGVLKGDLVVRGEGDPSISRRFDGDPLLADWASELAKKVRAIEGDVVADDRAFERLAVHPDWDERDLEEWYAAEVSALALNDNCVDVETAPEGDRVRVRAFPESSYVVLDVHAVLTGARGEHRIAYVRERDDPARGGTVIRVDAKVRRDARAFESSVPVRRPALFFATVLRERLVAAGVTVKGRARLPEPDEPEATGTCLFERRVPIARSVGVCNKRSQNLYAETLFKLLGHVAAKEPGSWKNGARAVETYLDGLKIPDAERHVADGSGLSRENRISARGLVSILLEATAPGRAGDAFRQSLAIAGEDGTLEKRLKDLPRGVVVRGKTGTMQGVSSLAGQVDLEGARGPERIVFAMIVNGTRGAATARGAQDELVRAIVHARAGRPTR